MMRSTLTPARNIIGILPCTDMLTFLFRHMFQFPHLARDVIFFTPSSHLAAVVVIGGSIMFGGTPSALSIV